MVRRPPICNSARDIPPSLASLLESFFRNRLTKQRNASRSTIASYRDALRLLVLFAANRTGRKPSSLAIEDIDRDVSPRLSGRA